MTIHHSVAKKCKGFVVPLGHKSSGERLAMMRRFRQALVGHASPTTGCSREGTARLRRNNPAVEPPPICPVYFSVRSFSPSRLLRGFAFSQDAREIVRRSAEMDQANWLRMADYTWVGRSRERHLDSHNRVTSDHQ